MLFTQLFPTQQDLCHPLPILPQLEVGWFWNRNERACVFIFFPMPSVHRIDYSCLQLKSRLSWPEVRREVSASCLTVETLFPISARLECNICNKNLGPLTGSSGYCLATLPGNSQEHLFFLWHHTEQAMIQRHLSIPHDPILLKPLITALFTSHSLLEEND